MIVCPRCGLGNRLRVMVSTIHHARQLDMQMAHLWLKDAPVRSKYLFKDEEQGTSRCDFEALFEPIRFCRPFSNSGQSARLLSEHPDLCRQEGMNIVEEIHFVDGPIREQYRADVDAILLLTSASLPITNTIKQDLYKRFFKPRKKFLNALDSQRDILGGRYLSVHLRKDHRTACGVPEWTQAEMVQATSKLLDEFGFDRIVVFADCPEQKAEFMRNDFNGAHLCSVQWGTDDYVENMFLDFLAISRASFIASTGLSSFPGEAAIFGGGVPLFDLWHGRQMFPND